MKKIFVTSFIMFFMMLPVQFTFAAEKKADLELTPAANSAVMIEQDTGTVLYDKEGHKKLPPASMTKIMTMLIIMEQIDSGKLKLTDKVRTSEYAASMGGSQIFLEPGEEMTVDEMLKGIAIGSGNDASVAMAEHIAGSEDKFVEMMNEKVTELGLKDTHFQNPTGLPEENHYSTAYDMAIMGRALLMYPEITSYTGKYEDYLRKDSEKQFWLVNTNKLVRFYDGADGLKTGFTAEAKYCLTATAKKDGMRVIGVIMGAPTSKERNSNMSALLDYGFNHYQSKKLYDKNQPVSLIEVNKGKVKTVEVVPKRPVSILLVKGDTAKKYKEEIKLKEDLAAPLKKGQEVGTIVIKDGEKVVSEVPLIVPVSVEKASWWTLFKRTFDVFS